MNNLLKIDGSFGEGGGQILRSSLTLSIVTGTPFRIENIRAKRKKPGLMRQHLTAVRAAAEISRANVTGDEIGSTELTLAPGNVVGDDYAFSVGTAGSTTLVLQTILLPLALARKPSRIVIEGGTHNPLAPPFDFLEHAYVPLLNRMSGHHGLRDTPFDKTGHPILLPGDPQRGSAVMVADKGANISCFSVNHGAGRVLGRKAAKRELDQASINASFDECDILTNCRNYPRDEAPAAYKDFDEVLRSVKLAGMASEVARLKARFVIKDASDADD